jgi:hypothetical protein
MPRTTRGTAALAGLAIVALTAGPAGQAMPSHPPKAAPANAAAADPPPILPTGLGADIDRAVETLRAATERFKDPSVAIAEGYAAEDRCIEHKAHGAMGYHFNNMALRDATLDLEKPEVLVYEKRPDGTLALNGVEYIVPIAAWTRTEPPAIMGQDLKRADSLGFWYLHVWNWGHSPSGLFADWNPRVKCP